MRYNYIEGVNVSAGTHEFVGVSPQEVFVAWSDVWTDCVVEHARTDRARRIRRVELRSTLTVSAVLDIHPVWVTRLVGVPRSAIVRVPFLFDGWRQLGVNPRAVAASRRRFVDWRKLAC